MGGLSSEDTTGNGGVATITSEVASPENPIKNTSHNIPTHKKKLEVKKKLIDSYY